MPAFATPPPHRFNRLIWRNSFYNQRVDQLPLDPNNNELRAALLADNNPEPWMHLTPFGQDNWNVSDQSGRASAGYFIDTWPADRNATRVNWSILRPERSTPNPHLYWGNLRQQDAVRASWFQRLLGQPDYQPNLTYGDRHAILWSEGTGELVEAIGYIGNAAKCEAIVTYKTGTVAAPNYQLPLGSTNRPAGVCAASIPIAPLLFTHQDLVDCGDGGTLGHMIGVSLKNYGGQYRWPARSADGTLPGSPIEAGMVLRLRTSFIVDALPNQPLRALARTLQLYGAVVYDRNFQVAKLTTPSDPAWPQGVADPGVVLGTALQLTEFDVVDLRPVAGPVNSIATTG
jgi:hypothetical protein